MSYTDALNNINGQLLLGNISFWWCGTDYEVMLKAKETRNNHGIFAVTRTIDPEG
ncbi:hypothetical protein [Paenibacillus glacialis]|uniref:hypothetical protein n=1 Tax=Paenibacillus glacialis TaxID=494026 RepID=UPI000A5FB40A|nr:hypothetical protein [Paenibacillus glacialis]